MTGKIYDVAIVGMGPVGAAAAILFADAGLDVAIVEKTEEIYPLPRAVGMDGEVVRAFQKLGKGEELNDLLQQRRPNDRVGFANSKREWMFGQEWPDFGVNGWQAVSMFDQPEIEQYFRDQIATYSNVDTFLGHEVTSFDETDSTITLTCTNTGAGESLAINALYLVACDGAASAVRKTLDINWHDLGYDHDWLVIDVVVKEGHTLNQDTLQVCDPDRIVTHVVTKDPFRRWEFKLNPGETWEEMLDPEKIYELLDPWTPRHTYTLRRKAVYQFHAATADEWRRGRIFIAGDAAHQTPPFLGQGMNAGMRDVINLAWKLPMVIRGIASDTLLDTYQSERMPHAQDLVEWAVAVGQLMEHLAAVEAAEREGREPPEVLAQKKSAGYGQGREAPPIREGVIMLEQVSDEGSTGYLFSQPIVKDPDGNEFRFDDRLGHGFSIITRSPSQLDITPGNQAVLEKLNIVTTSIDNLEEVRGHFDRLFSHADAVIVRPDRYVFGHTTEELDLNGLIESLKSKLALI